MMYHHTTGRELGAPEGITELTCDDAEGNCDQRYRHDDGFLTPGEIREDAAIDGWRYDKKSDQDFCPNHSHHLLPSHQPPALTHQTLTDDELAAIYAYPDSGGDSTSWVRANFVTSLDGAASVNGHSSPLAGTADKRVFRLLRALADVILVGAGTVRAEGYGDTHLDISDHASLRRAHRLSPVPPIAVVTRVADLDPTAPLFTHNVVPPLVMTTSHAAPTHRRAALATAGAEVVTTGDDDVSLRRVLNELAQRGLRKVLCEGGPRLFASLLQLDAVDELCLTLSPVLIGGAEPRASAGPAIAAAPASMTLQSVLRGQDDALLLRYQRRHRDGAHLRPVKFAGLLSAEHDLAERDEEIMWEGGGHGPRVRGRRGEELGRE